METEIRYSPIKLGSCVIVFVVFITVLSCMTRTSNRVEQITLHEQYAQEASKWGAIAFHENNPILKLVHINYAIACANAAKNMASNDELSQLLGGDFDLFVKDCIHMQDNVIKIIGNKCPNIKPDIKFARASGWV